MENYKQIDKNMFTNLQSSSPGFRVRPMTTSVMIHNKRESRNHNNNVQSISTRPYTS